MLYDDELVMMMMKSPSRAQGQAAEVCRQCAHILTAEMIKIQNCETNRHCHSWPDVFTVGDERHFPGV